MQAYFSDRKKEMKYIILELTAKTMGINCIQSINKILNAVVITKKRKLYRINEATINWKQLV